MKDSAENQVKVGDRKVLVEEVAKYKPLAEEFLKFAAERGAIT